VNHKKKEALCAAYFALECCQVGTSNRNVTWQYKKKTKACQLMPNPPVVASAVCRWTWTTPPWWRGDRCTTRVVTREDVSLRLWTTHANTNCVGVQCSHGLQVCTDCRVQFVRLSGIRIRSSGRLRLRLVNSDPRRRLGSTWIWIAHNSFSGACAFRMPVLPCIHAPVGGAAAPARARDRRRDSFAYN
jgi:hypothetical protein